MCQWLGWWLLFLFNLNIVLLFKLKFLEPFTEGPEMKCKYKLMFEIENMKA